MNFGKAKKILIFLFLFINIFLIVQLGTQPGKYTLQKKSIQNTIEIAKKNNVKVSEKIFRYTFTKLDILNLYNPLANKAAFSKQFKKVEYLKDGSFSLPINKKLKSETPEQVLKYLKNNGFEDYDLSYVNTVKNPVTNEKIYKFIQKYRSYDISGATLSVYVNKNKILKVEGNVYEISDKDKSDYTILSPLHIVLTFTNHVSSFNKKAEITEINQSYYIPLNAKNYKNISAAPCYIIKSNNVLFYYDAVQNTFLYCITDEGVLIEDINQAFTML